MITRKTKQAQQTQQADAALDPRSRQGRFGLPTFSHTPIVLAALACVSVLGACTVVEPAPLMMRPMPVSAAPVETEAPPPVVSVYAEAPMVQPAPLLVPWAPPPMLVQAPPPMPFSNAVWVGGYWAWQSRWVWSAGYWASPPGLGYTWVQPYYEHRGNAVVFVQGFWGAPGVSFAPPPMGIHLSLSVALPGIVGTLAIGPQGVFVPPPPGSVAGLIVPAPIGTPPAVVTSAPAIIRTGMRVTNTNTTINNINNSNNVTNNITNVHNTHVTNVTNVTNITNVRNVIVEAPASTTANHMAYQQSVPAHAALAAAAAPMAHWQAPLPQSQQHYALNGNAHTAMALPPAQTVRVSRPAPAFSPAPYTPNANANPRSQNEFSAPANRNAAPMERSFNPAPTRQPENQAAFQQGRFENNGAYTEAPAHPQSYQAQRLAPIPAPAPNRAQEAYPEGRQPARTWQQQNAAYAQKPKPTAAPHPAPKPKEEKKSERPDCDHRCD